MSMYQSFIFMLVVVVMLTFFVVMVVTTIIGLDITIATHYNDMAAWTAVKYAMRNGHAVDGILNLTGMSTALLSEGNCRYVIVHPDDKKSDLNHYGSLALGIPYYLDGRLYPSLSLDVARLPDFFCRLREGKKFWFSCNGKCKISVKTENPMVCDENCREGCGDERLDACTMKHGARVWKVCADVRGDKKIKGCGYSTIPVEDFDGTAINQDVYIDYSGYSGLGAKVVLK